MFHPVSWFFKKYSKTVSVVKESIENSILPFNAKKRLVDKAVMDKNNSNFILKLIFTSKYRLILRFVFNLKRYVNLVKKLSVRAVANQPSNEDVVVKFSPRDIDNAKRQ